MNTQQPYKVIVWGPGYLGQACIKQPLQRPEFELVGVLAYSESKNGKDAGELVCTTRLLENLHYTKENTF